MADALSPLKRLNDLEQAVYFHSRERRKSLAGMMELFRDFRIYGVTDMPQPTINATSFPDRGGPVTFHTAIRIVENSGVHKGLIFEIGSTDSGAAAWVGDQTIGFHAGTGGTVNGATALFDNGSELPVGLELDLVFSAVPGNGKVRVWANGTELVRSQASGGAFSPRRWASPNQGSFASAPNGLVIGDVPAASRIAPNGFEVIEPLSIYIKQKPRHFV